MHLKNYRTAIRGRHSTEWSDTCGQTDYYRNTGSY